MKYSVNQENKVEIDTKITQEKTKFQKSIIIIKYEISNQKFYSISVASDNMLIF